MIAILSKLQILPYSGRLWVLFVPCLGVCVLAFYVAEILSGSSSSGLYDDGNSDTQPTIQPMVPIICVGGNCITRKLVISCKALDLIVRVSRLVSVSGLVALWLVCMNIRPKITIQWR